MQDQIDLTTITDIKELKVLKADEYDKLEAAQRQVQVSNQNIGNLNARISAVTDEATGMETLTS